MRHNSLGVGMYTGFEDFDIVPDRVVLSGEGFRSMELSHFKTLARTLGRMGIQIEQAYFENDLILNTTDVDNEEIIIYRSTFENTGAKHGISKSLVTKTWMALTRDWDRFNGAKLKQNSGEELALYERRALDLPRWHQDLLIDKGIIVFSKLRIAHRSGMLEEITNFGGAAANFIELVISDIENEAESKSLQDDSFTE